MSPGAARRWRLAALVSHPIQYLVPLMRKLAQQPDIDLDVYFMDDIGIRVAHLPGGATMAWDVPLLDGYRHEFLPNLSPRRDGYSPISKMNPAILARLRSTRPDALYMHGYTTVTEMAALLAAKALRIPVLFHGDVVINAQQSRSPLLRGAFRRAFCASLDAALLPSSHARAFYARYGFASDRVFWAPLCVDNDFWTEKAAALRPRRAALRREMGADAVAGAGRPRRHWRSAARSREAPSAEIETRASLVMVGDGPLLPEVKAYVAQQGLPRVYFAGAKNQGELPAYYAIADVFLMTSEHEVNPLVVREAMCFSLPLVLSDTIEVTADFVREGENGFTYPRGDTREAAARSIGCSPIPWPSRRWAIYRAPSSTGGTTT